MAAIPSVSYTLDKVPLHHPLNYWWLEDVRPVGSNFQRRAVNMQVTGRDGVVPNFGETGDIVQIGFRFVCNAAGTYSVTQTYNALVAVLTRNWKLSSGTALLELKRTMFGQVHVAMVKLAALTDTEPIETGDSLRFTAVLTIPGGWWRDENFSDWSSAAPIPQGYNYLNDTLKNSAAPIKDAQIQLIGPMTGIQLYDGGSDTVLYVNQPIGATERILIQCDTAKALLGPVGNGWSAIGTDVASQVTTSGYGSTQQFFALTPYWWVGQDPFYRVLQFRFYYSNGGPTSQVKIRAKGYAL